MLKPRDIPLASSGFRGLLNKLSGVASQFLSGDGTWRNPLNPVQTDILFTDATNDIGKTGATRPRDGFFSRNVEIGGTINVAGNVVSDLKFTDASFDIGKNAATRPRDGFFSRTLTAGGLLDISGAAAGQVSFPAAQNPSAGVNVLDDYEEGAWTPAIASSGGGAATYTTQVGKYIKIGKFVWATGAIVLATKGTLGAGTVTITGLPFTSENTTSQNAAVPFINWTLTTAVVYLGGLILPNTTVITVEHLTAAATGLTLTTVADLSATSNLTFTAMYCASA